jgi:AraC-like DNA-binding protein
MEYLNHYRIERAQALLANTDDSMASISQEMGFCNQSYFGAVFRRVIGMTRQPTVAVSGTRTPKIGRRFIQRPGD